MRMPPQLLVLALLVAPACGTAHVSVLRRRVQGAPDQDEYEPDTKAGCPDHSHLYNATHCQCDKDYHIQRDYRNLQRVGCLPSCFNPKHVYTNFYGGKYNDEKVPCCRACQDGCGGYLSQTGSAGPYRISRKCLDRKHTKIDKGMTMGVCDGNAHTQHKLALDGRTCFRHKPLGADDDETERERECEQSEEGEALDREDPHACEDLHGIMWLVTLVLLICLCWPGIIFIISWFMCIHPKQSVEKRSPTSESWAICCGVFWIAVVFGGGIFWPMWFIGPFLMVIPFCTENGYTQSAGNTRGGGQQQQQQPQNSTPQIVHAQHQQPAVMATVVSCNPVAVQPQMMTAISAQPQMVTAMPMPPTACPPTPTATTQNSFEVENQVATQPQLQPTPATATATPMASATAAPMGTQPAAAAPAKAYATAAVTDDHI